MDNEIHVFRKITKSGIELKIKKKKIKIEYPQRVWKNFPKLLHSAFADSVSYLSTWHLPLIWENSRLVYHHPHPLIEPSFFKILVYSIPMSVFEYENVLTSDLLKKFYNYNFKTQFKAINHNYSGKKIKKSLKEKAVLLFSFGKESLLTYGLLKELGVMVAPFFMREPQSTYENAHKRKLANKFYEKTGVDIDFFPMNIGRLRQEKDLCWGWDIILSQYIFFLIPYFFYHQAKYLFVGNEQSCNFYTTDNEGYLVNPVFEQSVSVMQLLGNIPKLFFINTHIGSLVEPIHEIFVTYILHHRYPEIGRFQMSCFSEEPEAKRYRWCGRCEKCARIYIFLKALNISPERVGFYNNHMLDADKKNLYTIFNNVTKDSAYGGSGLGRDEQLLAFLMAYKNGVKGELIDEFRVLHLTEAEKKKEKLTKEFFGIHTSYSLPSSLRRRVLRIFEKEKGTVDNYLKRLLA
jgi:hypothetical protein